MKELKIQGKTFTVDPKVPGDYDDMDKLIGGYLPSTNIVRRWPSQKFWRPYRVLPCEYGWYWNYKPRS